jgi:release factor glutamine methyltransferase
MTVREALNIGSGEFQLAGFDTPYLDAVVLLCQAAGWDKARLYASFTEDLPPDAGPVFTDMVRLRLSGLPVSYIVKRKEFYGLTFYVDRRVLVPRPDTETLVETAISLLRADPTVRRIHDACTGTGCIPIAMAANLLDHPELEFSASDISEAALEVFRINSRELLGWVLPNYTGDLLSGAAGPFDMITANPPYLTRAETEDLSARGWPEPAAALDGGRDGLDCILALVDQAVESLRKNGYLVVEGTDNQAERIAAFMEEKGFWDLHTLCDLAGHRRVTVGRRG